MWISKKDYLELIQRIESLESQHKVHYGRYYLSPPEANKWLDGPVSCETTGKSFSLQEIVCKMANDLGFYYKDSQPGSLKGPKKGK